MNMFMKPVSLSYEFVFGVTMHTRSDLLISSGIARLDKLGGFNLTNYLNKILDCFIRVY